MLGPLNLFTVGQLGGNGGFCLIALSMLVLPFSLGRSVSEGKNKELQTSQRNQNAARDAEE